MTVETSSAIGRPPLFAELVAQVLGFFDPALVGKAFLLVAGVLGLLGFLLNATLLDRVEFLGVVLVGHVRIGRR